MYSWCSIEPSCWISNLIDILADYLSEQLGQETKRFATSAWQWLCHLSSFFLPFVPKSHPYTRTYLPTGGIDLRSILLSVVGNNLICVDRRSFWSAPSFQVLSLSDRYNCWQEVKELKNWRGGGTRKEQAVIKAAVIAIAACMHEWSIYRYISQKKRQTDKESYNRTAPTCG